MDILRATWMMEFSSWAGATKHGGAQQSQPNGMRHPKRFNAMLSAEKLLNKVAGPWRETAQRRIEWKRLEEAFVKRFDVQWASGKQSSLANLVPN